MSMITVPAQLITLIPVTDTSIYADGDQVGLGATELTNILRAPWGLATIESVTVIDKAKQKSKLDIHLFSSVPTLANVNNAAPDITDANAIATYLGRIAVLDTDYSDFANQSVASKLAVGLVVKGVKFNTQDKDTRSLWAIVVSRGTPTYTGAADLMIKLGVYQH
jgi:hypothetical protein